MNTVIDLIVAHKTVSSLLAFWLGSNFVTALPSPDQNTAGWYKFTFTFVHGLAGSLPRLFPALRLPGDPSRSAQTFFGAPEKPPAP
jgi:hypothetical protein